MKFYTVYKKSKASKEECVLVKSGFCWKNFFFGVFWAVYKKIWDLALIHLLFISIVIAALNFYPMFNVQIIVVALAVHVMLSFYVTDFLKWQLIEDGYKKIDLVASCTEEEALLRFLSSSKKS